MKGSSPFTQLIHPFMKRLSNVPRPSRLAFLPPLPPVPSSNSSFTTTRIQPVHHNFRHTHRASVIMSDTTSTKPSTKTTMASPATTHLYFCYGSNMLRSKLASRGPPSTPQITFTDVFKARLPNWQLCFDLRGAPPEEPAMGSIQPEQGDEVHGMVYRIGSDICWQKLLKSEGVTEHHGPYDSYHVVPVSVECVVNEKIVEMSVMTLVTNPRFKLERRYQPFVRPSQRYMNILIEGATQEKLPKEYVERLENTPVARRWKPSLLLFFMTLTLPFAFLSRKRSTRMFTYPLSDVGLVLYAMHEGMVLHPDGWSMSRGIGMVMCKIGMYLLYSLYAIPGAVVVACSPQARQFLKVLMKKRFTQRVETPVVSAAKKI